MASSLDAVTEWGCGCPESPILTGSPVWDCFIQGWGMPGGGFLPQQLLHKAQR